MSEHLKDAGKRKAELDKRIRDFLEKEIKSFTKDTGLSVSGVGVYFKTIIISGEGTRHLIQDVICEIE